MFVQQWCPTLCPRSGQDKTGLPTQLDPTLQTLNWYPGDVAQMVERSLSMWEVGGSIPPVSNKLFLWQNLKSSFQEHHMYLGPRSWALGQLTKRYCVSLFAIFSLISEPHTGYKGLSVQCLLCRPSWSSMRIRMSSDMDMALDIGPVTLALDMHRHMIMVAFVRSLCRIAWVVLMMCSDLEWPLWCCGLGLSENIKKVVYYTTVLHRKLRQNVIT